MNSEFPKTDFPKKNRWTRSRWLVIGGILLLVIIAVLLILDALPDAHKLEGESSVVGLFGRDVSSVIQSNIFVTLQPADSPLLLESVS